MKIYTKTGDDGTTGLLGTGRVGKDDPRIEAYGTVDELNAVLGLARAAGASTPTPTPALARVQDDLFAVGSALADPDPDGPFHNAVERRARRAARGARSTRWRPSCRRSPSSSCPAARPPPSQRPPGPDRLPTGRAAGRPASASSPARTSRPSLLVYLNRLSDLLFVLARAVNARAASRTCRWKGLKGRALTSSVDGPLRLQRVACRDEVVERCRATALRGRSSSRGFWPIRAGRRQARSSPTSRRAEGPKGGPRDPSTCRQAPPDRPSKTPRSRPSVRDHHGDLAAEAVRDALGTGCPPSRSDDQEGLRPPLPCAESARRGSRRR